MSETWEYAHLVFSQVDTTDGRQWCQRAGDGKLYALHDALNRWGRSGWELVSFGPEAFEHYDTVRNVHNQALADYPFQKTRTTLQRAVLKRRTS